MNTSCWILVEKGLKGTENQCIALAQAAGLSYTVKGIKLKQPWKTVTPWIRHFSPAALSDEGDALDAPWPDIVIASGRKAIAPALWIKKQSGGKTKLVVVQNPVIGNRNIDLVIAPKHDRVQGDNVLEITGALSVITPDILNAARAQWRERLEKYPSPRIAVLIGGNSRTHKMTMAVTQKLVAQLKPVANTHSLLITASRRTPEEMKEIVMAGLTRHPQEIQRKDGGSEAAMTDRVFFWDNTGDNPYRGFLAWADALIVTEDSVSMACEAVATGKPVYIIPMEDGSPRFRRFHDLLVDRGYARWFDGKIESWAYTPPDDLSRAAKTLKSLI